MRNESFRAAVLISCAGVLALTARDFALAQNTPQTSGAMTVIRAGTLIDGVSETPRKNQLIFVHGERIIRVTGAGEAIPSGSNVIDLSNATVLPGLIDSHTHIFLWGEDPAKGGYDENILKAGIALRAARATFAARRALEQGFTTLRDLETEGAGYGDVEIKQAIEERTIPGPRLFARRALFPPPAATTWKATRRNWTCLKERSLWMARWKHARRRGSNSITERTGSRYT